MIKIRSGQSVVELVIATAIMIIMMTAAAGTMSLTERMSEETVRQAQAISIAEEGVQAVISIADKSWAGLALGDHGLIIQPSPAEWVFQGTSDVSNGFTRTVTISSVDSDTKKIVVVVSWHPQPNRTASVEEQILLTDWAFI